MTDYDSIFDVPLDAIDGERSTLAPYRGQVMLIVNVASKCGFTPQYQGLQTLYNKYRDRGFVVLGFPCNQFGSQEPGSAEEIKKFCSLTYDVTFPLFGKLNVNGSDAHPLYKLLKSEKAGILGTEAIKWNFTKFLIGRDGAVVQRFGPNAAPESLEGEIEKLL